jgi:hypothetical protein
MMTKKQRKSSRQWCANRSMGKYNSSYGTPTFIPASNPKDDPIPMNRQAARIEAARERQAPGHMLAKEQRTVRKLRLKKKRRELTQIKKETRRSMAAA